MGKGRYLLKRLVYIVFVFFIISILMFAIYKSMPGNPVDIMLGDSKTTMKPDAYQALYDKTVANLGLDKPLPVQYRGLDGQHAHRQLRLLHPVQAGGHQHHRRPHGQHGAAQRADHGRGVRHRHPAGHCDRGAEERRLRQGRPGAHHRGLQPAPVHRGPAGHLPAGRQVPHIPHQRRAKPPDWTPAGLERVPGHERGTWSCPCWSWPCPASAASPATSAPP